MSRRLIHIALAVFVVLSCGKKSTTGPEHQGDDYSVYTDFITAVQWNGSISTETYVVRDSTDVSRMNSSSEEPWRIPDDIKSNFPELQASTIRSFESKNSLPVVLEGESFAELPVVLISEEEIHQIFDTGDWDDFYRRYPDSNGILTLSRVGFNENQTQALLYYDNFFASLGGDGVVVLLVFQNGRWTIAQELQVWIS